MPTPSPARIADAELAALRDTAAALADAARAETLRLFRSPDEEAER